MKKNRRFLVAGLLLLTLALSGCGTSAATQEANTASQTAGAAAASGAGAEMKNEWNTLQVKQAPQKIVTLDFTFLDMLTVLGITPIGNAGVGETKIPEYLEGMMKTKVTDVGERKAPNLEVIQSLQPDLIIASVDRHSMIRKDLEAIGPTVAFDDVSYKQVMDNLNSMAKALGKEAEAQQFEAGLDAKMEQIKQQIKGNPSIVVVGFFDNEYTVWVKDSFVGSLLSGIGANYAFNGDISKSEGMGEGTKMILERLHDINPDYIMMYGDKTDKLKNNPLFQDLKAVKDKHWFEVDRNLWARGRGPIAASKILDETLARLTDSNASK